MDFSRFTVKSQEALQAAQTKAIRYGHLEVDGEHLLLVLMEPSDGLVLQLMDRIERMEKRISELETLLFP